MHTAIVALVVMSTIIAYAGPQGPDPATATGTAVVIELFTSEGCSSCPPADQILAKFANEQPVRGARIIALGEHVDYWDHQGWRDPFSSRAFTARQTDYASRLFGTERIYTPQLVIDGESELVGSDESAAQRAIDRAARRPKARLEIAIPPVAPGFRLRGEAASAFAEATADRRSLGGGWSARLAVASAEAVSRAPGGTTATVRVSGLGSAKRRGDAELLIAITEDGLQSDVKRGENTGRTLTHVAVVRWMTTAARIARDQDAFSGEFPIQLDAAWRRDRLRLVVFVQEQDSRRIVAASSAPLS